MPTRGQSIEPLTQQSSILACSRCVHLWRSHKAVAFDEWVGKVRPELARAVEERIGAELTRVAEFIRTSGTAMPDEERRWLASAIEARDHRSFRWSSVRDDRDPHQLGTGRIPPHPPFDPARAGDDRTVARTVATNGPTVTITIDELSRIPPIPPIPPIAPIPPIPPIAPIGCVTCGYSPCLCDQA